MGSSAPVTVVSAKPVLIPAPERGEDLQVRVSAPAAGHDVPVIVFSHGFGCSMSDYDPLVDYWTGRGFAVLQPTHLDSLTLGIAVSAAALAASIAVSRHAQPMLPDFSAAFLFVAAVSFTAPLLATRLASDAGAELSGHRDRPVRVKPAQ